LLDNLTDYFDVLILIYFTKQLFGYSQAYSNAALRIINLIHLGAAVKKVNQLHPAVRYDYPQTHHKSGEMLLDALN
jgi:hypothetical protein